MGKNRGGRSSVSDTSEVDYRSSADMYLSGMLHSRKAPRNIEFRLREQKFPNPKRLGSETTVRMFLYKFVCYIQHEGYLLIYLFLINKTVDRNTQEHVLV